MALKHFIFIISLTILSLLALFEGHASERNELIPAPVKLIRTQGDFTISQNSVILCDQSAECASLAEYLNTYLSAWLGAPLKIEPYTKNTGVLLSNYISININTSLTTSEKPLLKMPADGYTLNVTPHGINITGIDRNGAFYGIQTLLQMLPANIYRSVSSSDKLTLNCVEIEDWPLFAYRGMMLDVARTFIKTDEVKRFIDRLSSHKINRFHWHLADDEGWRIEIKTYPELAKEAGFRGKNMKVKPSYGRWDTVYGGFYTQEEIRGVIEYAALRGIEIIPEIDLPGHSRAVARLHPEILCRGKHDSTTAGYDRRNVWCATREANYQMLDKIIAEISALFPSQYIHVGGDEVESPQWLACPECRKLAERHNVHPVLDHFMGRMVKILAKYDKKPAVWNEAVKTGDLDKSARVHGWENVKVCLDASAKGYSTVVQAGSYFYFDQKQSPWERGLTWAGIVDTYRTYSFDFASQGFTNEQMANIAGVEGSFWSELYLSNDDQYLYYQCYPRICALAELGWTQTNLRNTEDFHSRLYGKHFERLSAMGISFRLPPPSVIYADGAIVAKPISSNSAIEFSDDGTKSATDTQKYTHQIKSELQEKYLFRASYNEHRSEYVPAVIETKFTLKPSGVLDAEVSLPQREGLWYMRLRSSQPELSIESIDVSGADTTYNIIEKSQNYNPLHQFRFTATAKTKTATMTIKLSSSSRLPIELGVQFERSPYIQPSVTVTSTMGALHKFPLSRAADYNFTSYSRSSRTCQIGDSYTYTFNTPLDCRSIELRTGLSYLPRYHFPSGRVEISIDGRNFTPISKLTNGTAIISPGKTIKAIRVVSESNGNGDNGVVIQDLKIIPLYK